MNDQIAREMLRLYPPPRAHSNCGRPDFRGWSICEESKKLYETCPNAFLLAAVMDRQMPGARVYDIPRQLKKRMGHLDVRRIAGMSEEALAGFMGPGKHGPALHRFYNTISRDIVSDCRILVEKYDGDAGNIWKGDIEAAEVVARLKELRGVSQKIANMFARHLVTYYGVRLKGWEHIDVAVDRHVARVFLRTGLVTAKKGQSRYSVSELREQVVARARELSPGYPAALDPPAFDIGMRWCTEREARCDGNEGPCPLAGVCTKRKRHYKIV